MNKMNKMLGYEEFLVENDMIYNIIVESIIMGIDNSNITLSLNEGTAKQGLKKFQKKEKNLDANKVKSAVTKAIKGEDSPLGSVINKIKKFVKKEARRISKEMGINPQRVLQQFKKLEIDLT